MKDYNKSAKRIEHEETGGHDHLNGIRGGDNHHDSLRKIEGGMHKHGKRPY